jgi:hypothetical protein
VVRFLPFLISLVLSVYALFSCVQTPNEEVPYLPKLVWIVLIVFVPFVGPIVWLLMSRTQVGRDAVVRSPRPGLRPVAPDDDPDFLKSLDRYRDPRTTVKPPHDPPQDSTPPEKPQQQDKPKQDKPEDKKRPKDKKPGTPSEETTAEPVDGKA